jgi:hypothetical protein
VQGIVTQGDLLTFQLAVPTSTVKTLSSTDRSPPAIIGGLHVESCERQMSDTQANNANPQRVFQVVSWSRNVQLR